MTAAMDMGSPSADRGSPEADRGAADEGASVGGQGTSQETDSKSGVAEPQPTGAGHSEPQAGNGRTAALRRPGKRADAARVCQLPLPRPRKQRKDSSSLGAAAEVTAGASSGPASPAVAGVGGLVNASAPLVAPLAPGLANRAADDDSLCDDRSRELQRLQGELNVVREQYLQQKRRLTATLAERAITRKALSCVLVQIARVEDAEERDQVASAQYHLGFCRQTAPLDQRKLAWEGGYEADAIMRIKDRIREDRQAIERLRRQLNRQGRARASAGGTSGKDNEDGAGTSTGGGSTMDEDDDFELWEAREISNCRMSFLNREELAVKEREQRLEVERALHLKQVQRLEAAERSNFRTYPLLAERYQLLNLIGRGGFSEVFRAYDLENNRYCAVKIHELGKDMSDQQRQSFVRRAMREYDIQKTLNHPRVVLLQDCFPISTKAFGTVLELCEGETLDEHMKRCGAVPEREARGIVIQILSGLRYMNTNGRKIIHYDLKPGNLFFHCGEVKIADFGLSKVVHESFGESIDLTSQGAGTYWYLPPECFVEAGQNEPPKISNKVDVWSTGVIFFELLFKRRPFGHGQSQEALLRSCMAASQPFALEIPLMPKATSDAKDFLKRVLTVNREKRPDVIEAFNDTYLRSRWRMSAVGGALTSATGGGAVGG
mmetsp:Transcript_66350/g.154164  ORF Transcript_66350/g.154164 Transcript_66350/m.154164 type:complete len:663 (+) Transcript_66350:81-2069(+)